MPTVCFSLNFSNAAALFLFILSFCSGDRAPSLGTFPSGDGGIFSFSTRAFFGDFF
jgi:hypothetical protein